MHFLFQISSTLCKRASSTAFWPGFHEAEAIFSEQIVTPFFPYGLTYPLESAFLQGHITVRQRPIVMFRITDQSILSKKKIPLPVLLQDTSGCCPFLKRKFYYEIPPKKLVLISGIISLYL